ncbi:MAG: LPS export ABC transporter permease LptF [Gammaproteobacteria bacterium]
MIFMPSVRSDHMLRVFDRYLLKEVIHGWLAVTVMLWLILVSHRLVRYLADAAEGDIPTVLIARLLGLQMVSYLVAVIPFALALGVVIGLGRLYRDNEMTVMAACGVGPGRIYKPLLALAIVVALALGWLALYISPLVQGLSNRLENDAQQQADLTVLGAGRFNELQGGRLTFYAERLSKDKKQMENLFIVWRGWEGTDRRSQTVTAKSAYRIQDAVTGDDFMVLVDGYSYEGKPGAADYRIMQFAEYGIRIDLPAIQIRTRHETIPTAELVGSRDPFAIAELQWRFALPLSAIVLVVLAVPLCKSSPRQGRYGRTVFAVLLFVVYYNILATAKVWVEQGAVPPAIGLWWVPVLPVLLALMLLNGSRLMCSLGRRR